MEKEKAADLPPDFEHQLILHKDLYDQNDMESCQYKLKVCRDLMNLRGFEDPAIKDDYLDRLDDRDDFFAFMIETEHR